MLVEAQNDIHYIIRHLVLSINLGRLFHQVQQLSNEIYIPLVCM